MAVAAYASDLTDIKVGMTDTTGWTAIGGGASGLNSESDYFIIDSDCLSKNGWDNAVKGMLYNAGTTTVAAGDAVFVWVNHLLANALQTEASGGLRVTIGTGTGAGAYHSYYVAGSDNIAYDDRWICAVVDPEGIGTTPVITPDATTGTPTATLATFGATANVINLPSTPKGSPFAIGGIRHGRAFTVTDGQAAAYGTFVGAASYNDAGTRRSGQFQESGGVYKMQGLFEMGTASTSVDFRDANRTIFVARTPKVTAGFNGFEVNHASSRVDWTSITITALGTTSPGYFLVNDNADVNLLNCAFADMGDFDFLSASSALGCGWRNCGQITTAGADLSGSSVEGYEGTADTAAVIYDVNADPDGELDDMSFTMGTAATHALELKSNTPSTITLRNWTVSGYSAANGNNDSVLYNTSGKAITVNVPGNTGTISYKNSGGGSATTIAANTVTVKITTKDANDLSLISGSRVLLLADTGGDLPADDNVSLSETGGTVTVTHTAHGLANGDKVLIEGAGTATWNGVKTISNVSTNAYDYTV